MYFSTLVFRKQKTKTYFFQTATQKWPFSCICQYTIGVPHLGHQTNEKLGDHLQPSGDYLCEEIWE